MEITRDGWVEGAPPDVSIPDLPEEAVRELHGTEDMNEKSISMKIIDPRDLACLPVPEGKWIVQDWLPFGHVTAIYGDGGTGKTLIAQQLMTSCATGKPWLGLAVERCKVFGLFCEDDEGELHRRQDAINQQCGVTFSDLQDMRWVSGVGADNLLMTFGHDGRGYRTGHLEDLTKAAKEFGAKLIVIDTAADTFGGNENDRSQVRQYVGVALNGLAREIGGAVLLCAHPSRSGMSTTGDMDGGSTGWSNTVRSRWSLVRPKGDDTSRDVDERILSRRKANYASIGSEVRLRWLRGFLAPVQEAGGFVGAVIRAAAEEVFLTLLDEAVKAGRHVSESRNSGNYAPKLFAKSPNRAGYARIDFERAMEGLFSSGRIVVEEYGRSGDKHKHVMRVIDREVGNDPEI